MKPNHKRSHMISASFVHHQKTPERCVSVLSPFLRRSAPVETTKSEVIIDKQHNNVPNVVTKAAGQTMSPPLTLSQFIGRIINTFKAAFNNPSLIEYANQQGIGIDNSPTAQLPDTSSQPLTPSRSPSSQPNRSSSNY